MKTLLIKMAIRALLALLLKHANVGRLLTYIREADTREENNFSKKGYVYRQLKTTEGDLSEHLLNLIVELGVSLYKRIK